MGSSSPRGRSSASVDWDLLAWVRRASARVRILKLLAKEPKTKSEIAAALHITWSWAHHTVAPMYRRGLIVRLTSAKVDYGKIWGLSDLGRRVVEHL